LNQLDPALDLSTFRVIGKSFKDLYTEVLPNNILNFQMDSIMLQDSTSDVLASQGYIIYEIKPLPNAMINEVVYNLAEIYFDFNPAVVTNIVSNTLTDEIPSCFASTANINEKGKVYEMHIYPNPTTNSWIVTTSISGNWILLNAIGQKVATGINNSNTFEIDAVHLQKGFYILKTDFESKVLVRK